MYSIKIIDLKMCLVFEATWETFVKKCITEKEYFSMKTQIIQNTQI